MEVCILQHISIISIGKIREKWQQDGINEYIKRISPLAKLSIYELDEEKLPDTPSEAEIQVNLQKEGKQIIKKLNTISRSKIFTLCIEGQQISSNTLAEILKKSADTSENIVFIIGSSHGLSNEVKNLADIKISLSKMTFPHTLARLLLTEQIYRALSINFGSKYHK